MATGGWCGLGPFLFRKKPYGLQSIRSSSYVFSKTYTKKWKLSKSFRSKKSLRCKDNYVQVMELRDKILFLRDIIDLPPLERSASINELVVGTMEDLRKLYPEIISDIQYSETKATCIEQSLFYFCIALKSIGDSWMLNHEWKDKSKYNLSSCQENPSFNEIVECVSAIIDCIISMANERFDMIDEYVNSKDSSCSSSFRKSTSSTVSFSETISSFCSSPETPTSVLANFRISGRKPSEKESVTTCSSPLLWSLRVQSVEKLNPISIKHLLLPKLSHCRVNSYPAPNGEAIVAESTMINMTNEEIEVNLSRASSQKEVVEITNDIDSQTAETVEELPKFAPIPSSLEPRPPPPAPTPPTFLPQPPMTQRNSVTTQPPSQPPPLPPLPRFEVLPTVVASTVPPPPPLPIKVISTIITVTYLPPPPLPSPSPSPSPSITTETTVKVVVPQPPSMTSLKKGAALEPPPPMPQGNGLAPPPPPPGGAIRSLRPKKSSSKLMRSHQLGDLYRTLKGKVEGSNQNIKAFNGRKGGVKNGGKEGMADALAEMTKRSTYFQQIEADVKRYAKSIKELKSSISSFKSSDMNDLLVFHKRVESVLEKLTDESQVLARFEGFPIKKLETIRIAAMLYLKLDAIVYQLQNWKIVSPAAKLLDRVEIYFSKIIGEVDALERTKDDESKRFKAHGIQFDFSILIHIKESMVDVSSSCMELALKEKRELKAAATTKTRKGVKSELSNKWCSKMLWRAFQFAYRVYTFAGGHDERHDRLTRELALEIENESHHL